MNGIYTQSFNRRHGRVRHLFQDRYKAIFVQNDRYLLFVETMRDRIPAEGELPDRKPGSEGKVNVAMQDLTPIALHSHSIVAGGLLEMS